MSTPAPPGESAPGRRRVTLRFVLFAPGFVPAAPLGWICRSLRSLIWFQLTLYLASGAWYVVNAPKFMVYTDEGTLTVF